MKLKYALLLFLLGVGLTFLGLVLKLASFELVAEVLLIGLFFQLVGGGLMLYQAYLSTKN